MSFHDDLKEILPRLRRHALALTRNRDSMEDLVQDTVVRALAAQDSFTPGTNFAAWIHKILRNEFISKIRKNRNTVPLDAMVAERAEGLVADPANGFTQLIKQGTMDGEDVLARLFR